MNLLMHCLRNFAQNAHIFYETIGSKEMSFSEIVVTQPLIQCWKAGTETDMQVYLL